MLASKVTNKIRQSYIDMHIQGPKHKIIVSSVKTKEHSQLK